MRIINTTTAALLRTPCDVPGVGYLGSTPVLPDGWLEYGGDDLVPAGETRTGWTVQARDGKGWRVPVTKPAAPTVDPNAGENETLKAIMRQALQAAGVNSFADLPGLIAVQQAALQTIRAQVTAARDATDPMMAVGRLAIALDRLADLVASNLTLTGTAARLRAHGINPETITIQEAPSEPIATP